MKPVRYVTALANTLIKPDIVRARPIHIQLEPTSYCNLACIMCPHHVVVKKPRHMSLKNFQHIIDLIEPIKLTLSGLGEPLLNPDFIAMVHYAHSKGATVNTTTNGTMFKTDEKAAELITSGISLVSISVDAASAETYHKIRQQDWFDRVTEGIRRFRDVRKRLNSTVPSLRLCYVISQNNLHEVNDFVHLAKELEADMVYFQVLRVYNEVAEDWDNLVGSMSKEDYRHILAEAYRTAETTSIPTNLMGILEKLDVHWRAYDREQDGALCPLPWFSTYVDVDGYMRPCCQFCSESEYRMSSSLFDIPLGEAWNTTAYQEFRHEMSRGNRPNQICVECIPETLGDIIKRSTNGYSPGYL